MRFWWKGAPFCLKSCLFFFMEYFQSFCSILTWQHHVVADLLAAHLWFSTTSQRCSSGLRSGDSGGHWSPSYQKEAGGGVLCCHSPSSSRFHMLCFQRWYSGNLGRNKWSFELLLHSYHLKPVCPFSSNHSQLQGKCRSLFSWFGPFSVNSSSFLLLKSGKS